MEHTETLKRLPGSLDFKEKRNGYIYSTPHVKGLPPFKTIQPTNFYRMTDLLNVSIKWHVCVTPGRSVGAAGAGGGGVNLTLTFLSSCHRPCLRPPLITVRQTEQSVVKGGAIHF